MDSGDVYLAVTKGSPAPHACRQSEAIAWLQDAVERGFPDEEPGLKRKVLGFYRRLGAHQAIGWRRSFVADYLHRDWDNMELFSYLSRPAEQPAPDLGDRMELFRRKTDSAVAVVLDDLGNHADSDPTSLIEVSCTGYEAPSPVQKVISGQGWHGRHLRLGHMGCYAALPAVALASDMVRAGQRSVAVVAIEFCTLHLRPEAADFGQIVANTLFSDGCLRIDVSRELPASGFLHRGHVEQVVPNSLDQMGWRLGGQAFEMGLAVSVPESLRMAIPEAVRQLLEPQGLKPWDIEHVAIHPGGPRIIDVVAQLLELPEAATCYSRKVLYDHGNMSSVTVPTIWQTLIEQDEVKAGDRVLSLAFGPGLTVVANLLEVVRW